MIDGKDASEVTSNNAGTEKNENKNRGKFKHFHNNKKKFKN